MMRHKEKVSVLVTSKNRPHLLRDCLYSISQQTYKPGEVVVADASDTSQKIIIEGFKKLLPIRYFFVPGYNCASARNVCIKHARNNILLNIDDDCRAEKRWIEKMLKLYRTYPDATLISSTIVHVPKNSLYSIIIKEIRDNRRKLASKNSSIVYINSDNCLLVKEKLLQYEITFDEKMSREEDIDMVLQVKKKGGKVFFEKGSIVYHSTRSFLLDFLKQRFLNSGNSIRLREKWGRQSFHFYGSKRKHYIKSAIAILALLFVKKSFTKIISFLFIILLSLLVYELGYLYNKFLRKAMYAPSNRLLF